MSVLDFLVLSLATWRLSSLLVNEAGPWWIFTRIRVLTGINHDDHGEPVAVPEGFFPELLGCVWCTSIWVATGLMISWWFFPAKTILISTIFAFSSVSILANKYATE